MSASEGASTQCSNSQWASTSSAAVVCVDGSASACISVGTICEISGLRMTAPTDSSADLADDMPPP